MITLQANARSGSSSDAEKYFRTSHVTLMTSDRSKLAVRVCVVSRKKRCCL